jgi:hypothetical protein
VTLYAEAREPVSPIDRSKYIQWKLDSEDPAPGPRLDVSYDQVTAWDADRYAKDLPGCWADQGGARCRKKAAEVERAWKEPVQPWLQGPPPGWYQVVRELRRRAAKDGL